jgi:HSP20 family protein
MASRFLAPFSTSRGLWGRDPVLQLHRDMNRLFDDTLRDWSGSQSQAGGGASAMMPRIDVHEQDNRLEVTAELPGVDQKDVELRLDDDILTIRGEKRNERKDKQAHITERSYGAFQRSIQLPFSPDPNQVRAEFRDGVLTIAVPRQEQQDRSRRIEIGGAASRTSGQPISSAQGSQGGRGEEVGESERSAFDFDRGKAAKGQGAGRTRSKSSA